MRGPRQHPLVEDRVAVEDDACLGKQGRELSRCWIALVYDQRVAQPREGPQVPNVPHVPRVAQVIERAAHDRRTVDKDDWYWCAHRQNLRALRPPITGHRRAIPPPLRAPSA